MRRVEVLATGGTIASHHDGDDWINLDGAQLVGELGDLTHIADVSVRDIEAGPSSQLSVADMLSIVEQVSQSDADGVVVTHGTDTLELTAFVASLLVPPSVPVVFTGSMRPHSHDDPDGPRNMRDSIVVAASQWSGGVTVCMNGELHAPRRVRKLNASSVEAFFSIPYGPVGHVAGGVVSSIADVPVQHPLPIPTDLCHDVVAVTVFPGMGDTDLRRMAGDARAVVVEVFGDLNAPMQIWGVLHEWSSAGRLVVLASGAYTPTVDNDFTQMLGLVGAGGLTTQKARIAAMLALSDGRTIVEASDYLRLLGRHQ